jgi:hypothetical protein
MQRSFGKNINAQNDVVLGPALYNYIYKKKNNNFFLIRENRVFNRPHLRA